MIRFNANIMGNYLRIRCRCLLLVWQASIEIVMTATVKLLRSMYREYARSVGLPEDAEYLHGTPLRPVVPLDVASKGVLVLGAYPSARFAVVDGVADVPIADNLGPFENERWFDGARVRRQPSARELENYFFSPLEISRSECWVTNLVKVFLFKDGHVDRYQKLLGATPDGYDRSRFGELARLSLPWIEKEVGLACPQLVITLGREVAGALHNVGSPKAQQRLLVPEIIDAKFGSVVVPTIHCAHPGILMRTHSRNPWPELHRGRFIPVIRRFLAASH